jgi:hypothetical protein
MCDSKVKKFSAANGDVIGPIVRSDPRIANLDPVNGDAIDRIAIRVPFRQRNVNVNGDCDSRIAKLDRRIAKRDSRIATDDPRIDIAIDRIALRDGAAMESQEFVTRATHRSVTRRLSEKCWAGERHGETPNAIPLLDSSVGPRRLALAAPRRVDIRGGRGVEGSPPPVRGRYGSCSRTHESETVPKMNKRFRAVLQKGSRRGSWTYVIWPGSVKFFGTGGLVKVRGTIDGQPFRGSFMAMGNGKQMLPVKAEVRRAIGKEAGQSVSVHLTERLA